MRSPVLAQALPVLVTPRLCYAVSGTDLGYAPTSTGRTSMPSIWIKGAGPHSLTPRNQRQKRKKKKTVPSYARTVVTRTGFRCVCPQTNRSFGTKQTTNCIEIVGSCTRAESMCPRQAMYGTDISYAATRLQY
eukprot:1529811-Rhodomonas_salina.1